MEWNFDTAFALNYSGCCKAAPNLHLFNWRKVLRVINFASRT